MSFILPISVKLGSKFYTCSYSGILFGGLKKACAKTLFLRSSLFFGDSLFLNLKWIMKEDISFINLLTMCFFKNQFFPGLAKQSDNEVINYANQNREANIFTAFLFGFFYPGLEQI